MLYEPQDNFNICTNDEYPEFISKATSVIESLGVTGMFKSYDDKDLFYSYVLTKDAKASIVILHGYTEFLQKYYEAAWYFMNSGYNVFMYDMRGHGLSVRETPDKHLAHVNDFDDYARDLNSYIESVVKPNSNGLPLYMFSHSMGGAVAFLYLNAHPGVISKAVFCSPMIDPQTNGFPRFFCTTHIRNFGHRKGWDHKFTYSGTWNPNPNFLKAADYSYNRFMSNLNIRRNDWHYQNSSSTFAWMRDVMKLRDRFLDPSFGAKITLRILMMSAGQDFTVRRKEEEKMAKNLPNCEYYCFKNSKHTIYTGSDENVKLFFEKTLKHFATE